VNDDDRRSPLTPAMAMRVAIVGSLVLALFAIVFFRLWFLQVLTGDQYVRAAAVNRTRNIPIAAPRGEILDRSGNVLVNSTTARAVVIVPRDLPRKLDAASALKPGRRDSAVFARLATLVHIPAKKKHHCKVAEPPPKCDVALGHCATSTTRNLTTVACLVVQQLALSHFADVTIKEPVRRSIQFYIAERENKFPGVEVQQISVTGYPAKTLGGQQTLAAQTLGTVGRITDAETHEKVYKGVNQNATIGQTGLEAQYDNYLRGTFGHQQVQINAAGQPVGHGKTIAPVAGENLRTSLDAQLQRVGEESLQHSMGLQDSPGGAFVAMNPETGGVYALGSLPTFNANVFSHPISTAAYNHLFGAASGDPLFNRATQGGGPTGSTFKPITATAALESGAYGVNTIWDDTGQFCTGVGAARQCRHNSGNASYGPVNLVSALRVSDDTYFYHLGALTNADPADHPHGGALQTWARDFGIGRNPGIDLPGSGVGAGTLPDPLWRDSRNKAEAECDSATGPYRYSDAAGNTAPTRLKGYHRSPTHPPGGCGIADGTNRPWSIGDNISLAVGQGDVQVTPLQLAVAYSTLENGGSVVRPHIGESIQKADGTVLQKINPAPSRHININPTYLDAIKTGLHEAATSPGGTSVDVMGSLGLPVYGKTGTAQYTNQPDYAWYSCFVPATDGRPPITVVVWVQRGSFGDIAAAPVARQILSQWFKGKPGPFISGTGTDQ
jgi:penicillin-binding protein 2